MSLLRCIDRADQEGPSETTLRTSITRIRRGVLLNPCVLIGLVLALWTAANRPHRERETDAVTDRVVDFEGWVSTRPTLRQRSVQFSLRPLAVGLGGRRLKYSSPVLVSVSRGSAKESSAPVRYGEIIRLRTRLLEPGHFRTPGVPDRRELLFYQGISHEIRLKSAKQIEHLGTVWWLGPILPVLSHVRSLETLCRGLLTVEQRRLLLGVSFGRRDDWSPRFVEKLTSLGIGHVFVVSGLHVSLLVALLHAALRRIGKRAVWVCLPAMWFYVLLVGFSSSTVRAGIMTSVCYMFVAWGLSRQILNALGLSAVVALIWNPTLLFTVGFQFSYLSLLAIGFFVIPAGRWIGQTAAGFRDVGGETVLIERAPEVRWRRRVRYALEARCSFVGGRVCSALLLIGSVLVRVGGPLLWCSLCIQAVTLPLALFHWNTWVWTQPLANLFLAPFLGLLVPIGLVLLALHATPLGVPLVQATGIYLGAMNGSIDLLGQLAQMEFLPQPTGVEALLYLALLFLAAVCWSGSKRWLLVILPAVLWIQLHRISSPDGRFSLTMLDVGQGECIHLEYPDGRHGLIDTGGMYIPGSDSDFIGRFVTARYLWERRLGLLEYVLLTHPHSDHIGALPFVRDQFHPVRIYTNDRLTNLDEGPSLESLGSGRTFEISGVRHTVLHPPDSPAVRGDNVNDRSLVVRVEYGSFSMLLTGDITWKTEARLVASGSLSSVTILKTPHHGSASSSSESLLESTRPRAALTSCGRRNPFNHPSPQTVDRFERRGISHYDTATRGTLRVVSDGQAWELLHYDTHTRKFRVLESGK